MPEEPIDDYESARSAYTAVRERLTEITAEITRLEAARWAANGGDDLDAAAEAYLAGAPRADSFEPELKKLAAERDVVERAVGIARKRFGAAREARHNELTKTLRPAHRQAAARVADCLIRLAEANGEEARVRQQAPAGKLPFLGFPGVYLGQSDSQAKYFLAYVKERLGTGVRYRKVHKTEAPLCPALVRRRLDLVAVNAGALKVIPIELALRRLGDRLHMVDLQGQRVVADFADWIRSELEGPEFAPAPAAFAVSVGAFFSPPLALMGLAIRRFRINQDAAAWVITGVLGTHWH